MNIYISRNHIHIFYYEGYHRKMISSETHFQVILADTIKQFFFFFFFYRSFAVKNYEHAAGEYPVTELAASPGESFTSWWKSSDAYS
jgi:hypothetical protein